jgi:hypothetical protein
VLHHNTQPEATRNSSFSRARFGEAKLGISLKMGKLRKDRRGESCRLKRLVHESHCLYGGGRLMWRPARKKGRHAGGIRPDCARTSGECEGRKRMGKRPGLLPDYHITFRMAVEAGRAAGCLMSAIELRRAPPVCLSRVPGNLLEFGRRRSPATEGATVSAKSTDPCHDANLHLRHHVA